MKSFYFRKIWNFIRNKFFIKPRIFSLKTFWPTARNNISSHSLKSSQLILQINSLIRAVDEAVTANVPTVNFAEKPSKELLNGR